MFLILIVFLGEIYLIYLKGRVLDEWREREATACSACMLDA